MRETKTDYYRRFIGLNAQAVAQPNINAKQYGSLKVIVPPLDLQHAFAAKIEALEQQKTLIKKSLQETETLLASRTIISESKFGIQFGCQIYYTYICKR